MKHLLIDSNGLCYRYKFGMPNLSYEDQKVEIIFGFMKSIIALSNVFKTDKLVFAWDSRKSFRKNLFPDYKRKRQNKKDERTPEEKELDAIAFAQFQEIRREVLPALGFRNNFIQTGIEGDDIIASIIKNNPSKSHIIVSKDQDFYQLLEHNVSMFNFNKHNSVFTKLDFENEFGIDPKRWNEIKIISGCSSDEVPGVKGVAEKTALKYILNMLKDSSQAYKNIEKFKKSPDLKRNEKLVVLPFKGTNKFKIKKHKLYARDFVTVCDKYGFGSFLYNNRFREIQYSLRLL